MHDHRNMLLDAAHVSMQLLDMIAFGFDQAPFD
jgi:hypothetical protein